MSEDSAPRPATAARLETFAIFAAEHSKYAYFLLAVAAAAIVYALDKVLEEPRHPVDCLAFAAVVLWGTSFAMGCERVKRLLVGLYKPIAEPSENPLSLGEIAREAGSSAKTQYYLFVGGVIAYATWALVTYFQS